MNEVFMAFVVLGTISYGLVAIIRSFTDFFLKRRLIEKAQVNEGFSSALSESIRSLTVKGEENKYPALKWGLVCLFAGIGLISIEYLQFDYRSSPLPYGIILASVAIGFLFYFFIARKGERNNKPL